MRRYETICIIDPDLSAEGRAPVLSRVADLIGQYGGLIVLTDEWGSRKLAYAIRKKERGYYVRFDYCGENALVDEIERSFRIDDRILKYMTILTDSTPDIEKIQAEITKAQEDERRAAEDSTSDESGVQAEPESGADEPVAAEAAAVDEPVVAEAAIDDSQKEDK